MTRSARKGVRICQPPISAGGWQLQLPVRWSELPTPGRSRGLADSARPGPRPGGCTARPAPTTRSSSGARRSCARIRRTGGAASSVSAPATDSGCCVATVPARARRRRGLRTRRRDARRRARTDDLLVAAVVRWAGRINLTGPHAASARRSALVLKALTYAPTGAIAAAPTPSLPESLGGERQWDYRYAWVRDPSFSSRAFAELGCVEEADAFRSFIMRSGAGDPEELRIVYGVGGERRLSSSSPEWLEGLPRLAPGARRQRRGPHLPWLLSAGLQGERQGLAARNARAGCDRARGRGSTRPRTGTRTDSATTSARSAGT